MNPEHSNSGTTDSAPASPLQFDICCLGCGYNLRGLSGGTVRCPECAQLNVVENTAQIPESLIVQRLQYSEAAPLTCVAAVLFALPWQFMFWLMFVQALYGGLGRNATHELLACPGVPAFGPLLIWGAAVLSFRTECQGQPGWGRLLVRYHLLGLGAGGTMLVIMLLIPEIWSPLGRGMRIWNYLVPAVAFGAAIIAAKRLLVAPHRRLMADIFELQRPAAISAIREEARKLRPE